MKYTALETLTQDSKIKKPRTLAKLLESHASRVIQFFVTIVIFSGLALSG